MTDTPSLTPANNRTLYEASTGYARFGLYRNVGVATVITTATASQRGGDDTIESVDLAGNRRNLIDAAALSGVRQFIFVSALGATPNSPAPMMWAKGLADARLREIGMGYAILALNGIMDVMLPVIVGGLARAGQPVTLVGEGRRRHSWVAAADVAAFAVTAIGNPAALNQRLVIGGPEAVSWRDVAISSYERVLGSPIPGAESCARRVAPQPPSVPGLADTLSGVMAFLESIQLPDRDGGDGAHLRRAVDTTGGVRAPGDGDSFRIGDYDVRCR